MQNTTNIFVSKFLADCRKKCQFWIAKSTSITASEFFLINVELYEAIKRHDIAEAKHVCSRAKGNINYSDTLIFVVENNMNTMFNMLKRFGVRFNFYSEFGINLILTAITKRNFDLCINLLNAGITKNTRDYVDPIPIWLRVLVEIFRKGTINEYRRLMTWYANKFRKGLIEQTLIHYVIERKDLIFCKTLIADGFNVNSRDNSGNLPVHVAAQVGDNLIMEQLIKSNAGINATNDANQAPLHLAAKNGHKEVFDILKRFDVDDFKDDFGKTAEEYALEHGHYDKLCIEYLSLYS